MRIRLAAAVAAAWLAGMLPLPGRAWDALPSRRDDRPGFEYTPSPADWRDVVIYQVLTDRFFDGDPSNNAAQPDGDMNPYAGDSIHGGDFRGLEAKLDYVQMLGANAIWISPVLCNLGGAYHGYHITDFNRIDPHWGTLEDLRSLVDAAHRRGILVILDVVFNHMGRLLASDDPGYPAFRPDGYTLRWKDEERRFAPPFDDLARFHNFGVIEDWNEPAQVLRGELRGLPDLRTEEEAVRADLVRVHAALVAATDCDGFRVDTARHVDGEDWDAMLPPLYAACAALGKTNFLLVAESLRFADEEVAPLTGESRFNSALYYPLYAAMQDVFVRGGPTQRLTERLQGLDRYGTAARHQLVAFLDNHDQARLLSAEALRGDTARLNVALAWLFTGPFIPCLYYGTEQGFAGGQGHHAREDMFDGRFESGPSLGDNFNFSHEIFLWVRRLAQARAASAALRYGSFEERRHDPSGPGLYIFSRRHGDEEVLVVLNTSSKTLEASAEGLVPATSLAEGTVLVDLLNPGEAVVVGSGDASNRVDFTVPGNGVRLFGHGHTLQGVTMSVVACDPPHDAWGISTDAVVRLHFDRAANASSIEAAFATVPPRPGAFTWNEAGTEMTFTPAGGWPGDRRIELALRASAASAEGPAVGAGWSSHFFTRPAPPIDTPLGDFMLDGQLDPGVPLISEQDGLRLFARFDPKYGALYVATDDAGEGDDRFILVADELDARPVHPAPWAKHGRIAGDGPFLADENDNTFAAWRQTRGSANAATGPNGGVLEGVLNVREQFGVVPERLFLAVVSYGTEEGGALNANAQIPAAVTPDGDVDADEFAIVPLNETVHGSETRGPGGANRPR